MAIVPMQKLELIGLLSEKQMLIDKLMKLGVLHIIENHTLCDKLSFLGTGGDKEAVRKGDIRLNEINTSIKSLLPYSDRKKGLFEKKKERTALSEDEINQAVKTYEQILQLERQQAELCVLRNQAAGQTEWLEPWLTLDIPIEMMNTACTQVIIGTIPKAFDVSELEREVSEFCAQFQLVLIDQLQSYVAFIVHNNDVGKVMDVAKRYGFGRVTFNAQSGTAKQLATHSSEKAREIQKEILSLEKKEIDFLPQLPLLEAYYDKLSIEQEQMIIEEKLVKSEQTFYLTGWLPSKLGAQVVKDISRQFTVAVELSTPTEQDEFPVLLDNPGLIQPFEAVTEQYSLPAPHSFDPNKIMAPFYFIFFGMMLSDAGYGIVLALLCGFVFFKYKPEGLGGKLISMLALCGISTIFWGIMFGSWFGDILADYLPPVMFNPQESAMELLGLSFALGGIHLAVGMAANAYGLIRKGKIWDAVFDVGFWYVLLAGIVLLFLGGTLGQVGKYMALIGAVGILFTAGRENPGIVGKITGGFGSLYGITGYLSDVLSYSRLLALGLSTGVVATVVNTMGALGGPPVFVVVFIVGHALNLAINVLGAYVHSCRLQYVEFFGKFYEGGGKPFRPFKRNTKYVVFKEEC